MKRTLSLFLSIVLVFTMMSGAIVVEASTGSEDVKLVRAPGIDITGKQLTFKSKAGDSKTKVIQILSDDGATKTDTTFSQIQRNGQAVVSIASDGIDPNNDVIRLDRIANPSSAYRATFTHDGADGGVFYFMGRFKYYGELSSTSSRFYAQTGFAGDNAYFKKSLSDFGIALSSGEWYDFEYKYDLEAETPTITATYTNSRTSEVKTGSIDFVFGTNKATHVGEIWNEWTLGSNGSYLMYDDLRFIHDDGTIKAKITSVGSDGTGVIPHSQNKVKFTLNKELPGLTKDHVLVKSRQGGTDITASEITVTSDATAPSDKQWIVEATLSQDLAAWSEYDIAVSKDYYEGYKEVSGTAYIPVTDITKDFSTPSAPLDIRAPIFANDGSATTDLKSEIGNVDMTFVYTNTASSGYIKEVKSKDFSVNGTMNGASISFDNGFASGDTAKLFVIKGWNNPVPLFSKSWAQSYDGTVPEADAAVASTVASSGEMILGDFDYTNKEMTVDLNAGSDAADKNGVLYIYKRGTTMKDNLIYADFVTTANNGSLKKTIVFPEDINDTTGEYTVAFYVDNVTLSKDFPIYDSDAAFGGNILKAPFNAKGIKYDTYKSNITESILDFPLGVAGASTTFDENAMNIKFSRTDKEDGYRINLYPGTGKQTEGVHTVRFKLYGDKAKSDGTIDWLHGEDFAAKPGTWERGYIAVNRVSADNIDGSYDLKSLLASTWYDIEVKFDLEDTYKSYITVTNIATGEKVIENSMAIKGTNGFTNMWMYLVYDTESSENNLMLIKDLQILADYGDMKSVIRYIGNDGIVDYGQREVTFKISENNGITKDNVYVKDSQGNIIKAKSISVTEDMGEYIVTATLEKDLASWQIYTLMVDAVGYEEYVEYVGGKYVPVTPISRDFATPAAPIDITDPIITSDGSSVTFEADIANTTQNSVDATTILAVVSSDGIMQSVTADPDTVTSNKTFTNTNAFEDGNSAEYFVIKGFDNPVPLFNKTWGISYDGKVPAPEAIVATDKAQAKTIVLDEYEYDTEFDHANKKIVVNLNAGANAPIDGVLYVYSGDTLSADSVVYANYVTTANDGTLLKEIKFDPSIVNTTKNYTVAFYSNDVATAIEESFDVYNEADYLNYKRDNIFENVKKATTFSGIKQIITGTDDMGNTVCDAWTIFSTDTDVSVYNTLKNKENVFVNLSKKAASLTDYDALRHEFENLARDQKNAENNPKPAGPSSNNKTPGSSSVSMSATPTTKPSDSGSTGSGSSVFTDMSGHWGQKYAEALVARGVVNGYADGSFRGDSPITRAELTKIVVEALNIPATSGKTFGDVAASSWYADYVSRAATAGVVNGFEDGSFAPDRSVTRQDAVLMVYRAMKLSQELPEGFKFFADEKDIQDYASEAIRCLGDLGIITGNGKANQFLPQNNITRAEMAAVVCRALDYMESHMQ